MRPVRYPGEESNRNEYYEYVYLDRVVGAASDKYHCNSFSEVKRLPTTILKSVWTIMGPMCKDFLVDFCYLYTCTRSFGLKDIVTKRFPNAIALIPFLKIIVLCLGTYLFN